MVPYVSSTVSQHDIPLGIRGRSYRQSDLVDLYGPRDNSKVCPFAADEVVNVKTGEVRPAACKNAECHICNRAYARRFHRAVLLSMPTTMPLFTGLTGIWLDDSKRMTAFLRLVRGVGFDYHLVYAIEPNPQRTGHHAQGWAYGDRIPPDIYQSLATRAGLGISNERSVTNSRNFSYILKGATWNSESVAEYKVNNGTQRIHPTRPFWRDHRTGEFFSSFDECSGAASAITWSERQTWIHLRQPKPVVTSARALRHQIESARQQVPS